jgi:hypothetical protein
MSLRTDTDRELRPLDRLFAEDRRSVSRANAILEQGWQSRGLPPLRLAPPMPWDGVLAADRAWGTAIHAWDPLAPLLAAHDETRQDSYLAVALAVALDWIAIHPIDTSIWQDLPSGRRAHRLAFLLDASTHAGVGSELERARLRNGLELQLAQIAALDRFAAAPGIALEQASGQLSVAARWPELRGSAEARSLATKRLTSYFEARVGSDGGPREHSPGVLWAELRSLAQLFATGLLEDDGLRALHDRALAGLAWFVTPAGRLAPFGDTDADVTPAIAPDEVADPVARWIFANGRDGEPPSEPLRRFPATGHAVVHAVRGRTARDGSYLAQAASFQSTRHKHADDLGFVWHDEGVELLTDPGRYGLVGRNAPESEEAKRGFRYSDPRRSYVESTGAHNTVEIDGRSDTRSRAGAYGSALGRTTSERGAFLIESEVRRESVRHTRLLAFRPRNWLVVIDVLSDSRSPHDFVQRFQFAPEVGLVLAGGRASATLPSGRRFDVLPLIGADEVSGARGRESPALLGWVSPGALELVPAWTLSVAGAATQRHVFVTAFVLSDSGAQPLAELVRSNPSGRRLRVGWSADGRRHQVDVTADGDDLSLRHRAPVEGT